eukprot:7364561-Prymnesium_polylepis.2
MQVEDELAALSTELAGLVEQGDRLAALSSLKTALPALKLGRRQLLVNGLQKELRESQAIDVRALAAALADLMPFDADTPGATASPSARVRTVYHIFGDSHTHVLAALHCDSHAVFAYPFVAGSAMGLRHAASRSGYRTALEADLEHVGPEDGVVFKFGQVDVDFVYYLKLVDNPTLGFDDFTADSVA